MIVVLTDAVPCVYGLALQIESSFSRQDIVIQLVVTTACVVKLFFDIVLGFLVRLGDMVVLSLLDVVGSGFSFDAFDVV